MTLPDCNPFCVAHEIDEQFIVFVVWCKGENRMIRCLLFTLVLLSLHGGSVLALELPTLVMTTAVVDREPVDRVEVFPRQSGMLYCFSRIAGAAEETTVAHAWFHNDQLMTRTVLPVRSSLWRTWSAKQMRDEEPGDWRVEVRDAQGNLLQVIEFTVR